MFKIKAIYEAAYGITLDASSMPSSDVRTTIRSDIRRWITHWDLKRYDPTYTPAMTEEAVCFDPSEVDEGVMEDMYSELAA